MSRFRPSQLRGYRRAPTGQKAPALLVGNGHSALCARHRHQVGRTACHPCAQQASSRGCHISRRVCARLYVWCDLLAPMSTGPTHADDQSLTVAELREKLRSRLVDLEAQVAQTQAEIAQTRQLLDSLDAYIGTSAPSAGRGSTKPRPRTAGTEPVKATVPQQILTVLGATPGTAMSVRELTETLYGPGASRSNLEGVRKAALRLERKGQVSRPTAGTFVIAAEVGH